MQRAPLSPRSRGTGRALTAFAAGLGALALSVSCSSDGGTPPITVASVVITAPTVAPTFQTLGRTSQFGAEARTASNTIVPGLTPIWSSSDPAVASVSASGLVTALLNGTTNIRASASGVESTSLLVTVAQVADATVITPAAVQFGAVGSTRALAAVSRDSSGAPIPGAPTITWTRVGDGATASVSAAGLVTALAVGTSDTAVATIGSKSAKAPISVTQVAANILVTVSGTDTLQTTGRTRTYSATVRDSQSNPIAGAAAVTWSSTAPAVATVASNGVATAIADGNTNVRATLGAVIGERLLTVRRYAAVFDLAPLSATISTPAGTQLFTLDARDSTDVVLPATWLSRSPSIASLSPAAGASTTVSGVGNGATFVLVAAGTRTDSANVTVSGQVTIPLTAGVSVGNNFFRSVNNLTQNMAIDTVAVGGTVTWTWLAVTDHNVESTGSPSFVSGPIQQTGTFQRTFSAAGIYQYDCSIHGAQMTGQIVVR